MEWNYSKMERLVRKEMREKNITTFIDVPIPVTVFKGYPCSLFGAPLERDENSTNGLEYREMTFPRFNPNIQKQYRETNGRIVILYPDTLERRGRYLIAYETTFGMRQPIIEVSNGDRAVIRAGQWAQLLQCDFQKQFDGKVVVSLNEYQYLLRQIRLYEPSFV